MTRKECTKWFSTIKYVTSSLFNRKCMCVLIGVEEGVWYFTNAKYNRSDDPKKREDEFYMYKPATKHYMHSVRINPDGLFKELYKMFAFVEEQRMMILLLLDNFNSAITTALNTKAEAYTFSIKIQQSQVMLIIDMNGTCSKHCVGYLFNIQRTEGIHDIMLGVEHKLKQPIPRTVDITNTKIQTGNFSIVKLAGCPELPVPMCQGYTMVAHSYRAKVNSNGKIILHAWPVGGCLWDTVSYFHDENIDVVSYHMNKFIAIMDKQGD